MIFFSCLSRLLKHKKDRIGDRHKELTKLRNYIVNILPKLEPALDLDSLKQIPVIAEKQTGKELKAIEDQLYSILYAFVAAHWWYWGQAKNMVLGNLDTGFIIIPNS